MGSIAPEAIGQKARYIMPAESERHSHTLMAFPSIDSVDSEEHLVASQNEVTSIANTISRFQPVQLYARPELVQKAQSMVNKNVSVKQADVDQLWIRDSGPVYVRDQEGRRVALNLNFNYWGNKLPHTGDQSLARHIAQIDKESAQPTSLVIEGGGIEIDGEGTFLATESCIINDNRNPGMSKRDIEAELNRLLGVESFIWLPGVRDYDITDFHIDALARFIRPGVVLLSKPSPNAPAAPIQAYEEARAILRTATDAKGRTLEVRECEEPDVESLGPSDDHNEVVASYANYLLVNGAVIMPEFGVEPCDQKAYDLFVELFPDRQVVRQRINMLPRTGGGIHCATQQVPA